IVLGCFEDCDGDRMNARLLPIAGWILATIAWSSPGRAGDQDLEGLLNEAVVTAASDTAETGRDAPATSTVITGESLQRYGIQTLAEALNLLGLGTMSGQSTAGGSTDMGARGVTIANSHWEHFLLLIDGARANGVFYGEADYGPAAVPLEIVDHIEVILGPGSVLYGSNAMLGVINVVTKGAKDFSGFRVGIDSAVSINARPWAAFGGKFEAFGSHGEVTAELEYFRQWGPNLYFDAVNGGVDPATGRPYRYTTASIGTGVWGGANSTKLSEGESPSLVGRIRLGKFELSMNGQVSRAPIRASAVDFDAGASNSSRRILLNLAYSDQVSAILAVKAHAYLNAEDATTTLYTSWAPECAHTDIDCRNELLNQGIVTGFEATPSFDWFGNGTFVTLVGADVALRSGRSIFNQYNAATDRPVAVSTGMVDHQDVAFGAYAEQTWNPSSWLGINGGGRLDYDPRFSPVLSPRIAVRVDPWRGGTLKVIYSEAFRAPSFFESYFSHPLNPLPDNLKPERVRSVETSVEQRYAAQRLMFGAFATQWSDLISYYNFSREEAREYVAEGRALLPPLYQYRNLSTVRNWGYNAAFEGTFAARTLQYGVNLTAAMARVDDAGTTSPMTVSPRVFGNAHVAYRLPDDLPTLALAASIQSERPVENAFVSNFSTIPYVSAQLVLRATVSGEFPWVPGLWYRVTGFYSTTTREPYLPGPNVAASAQYASPALLPIDRARLIVGLEYRFNP
ncbi:MAG: TonB-dependent receptor, partial [Myxococcota bacterium]|nr:TonB-dependent receptor [Myxococcota bacterium]